MSKYHFFFGGPFSQWAPAELKIDGITYNCAEQYMMAQKAQLFQDYNAFTRIMAMGHPAQQKVEGRKVKNFEPDVWSVVARDVVARASLVKFQPGSLYYPDLKATRGLLLVEASPTDTIWGIGLDETDPKIHRRRNWRGTNWLGQVLTDVRISIHGD